MMINFLQDYRDSSSMARRRGEMMQSRRDAEKRREVEEK
jgi:hypothetical protein